MKAVNGEGNVLIMLHKGERNRIQLECMDQLKKAIQVASSGDNISAQIEIIIAQNLLSKMRQSTVVAVIGLKPLIFNEESDFICNDVLLKLQYKLHEARIELSKIAQHSFNENVISLYSVLLMCEVLNMFSLSTL